MTIYNRIVPCKCESPTNLKCKNVNWTLKELGVFYESAIFGQEEKILCLCEDCHFKHGLGKGGKNSKNGKRFEIQNNHDWLLIKPKQSKRNEKNQKPISNGIIGDIKKLASHLPFAEFLVASYYCVKDAKTPRYVIWCSIIALAYFFSPYDILSESSIQFFAGYFDDMGILAILSKVLEKNILDEHSLAAQHFMDNKIVSDCSCPFCINNTES